MAFVLQRTQKDCVIAAISNYFGKEYEVVLERLDKLAGRPDEGATHIPGLRRSGGYYPQTYKRLIAEYLGREPNESRPRRGRERITGLVRLKKNGEHSTGHLTCVIDGWVFDTSSIGDVLMMPLVDYCRRYRWHVNRVWS